MTIKDMHYDFKSKLNKIDSSQYRNLYIPEIDRKLNEAAYIFIKSIAQPRFAENMGIEMNQRTIEDLRTLIIDGKILPATTINNIDYFVTIPDDYLYPANMKVLASKGSCTEKVCEVIVRKHNDKHELSPFDISSFEWREVNVHFVQDKIRIFTDGTFIIHSIELDYLRKMEYMHNAEDFNATGYELPNGTLLTGRQDCELTEEVHGEIVDLAVLITSGEINAVDFQLKQMKIQLNQ